MTEQTVPDKIDTERMMRVVKAATPGPWVLEHRSSGCGDGDDEQGGLGWDWAWKPGVGSQGPPDPMLRGFLSRASDAEFVMAFDPIGAFRILARLDFVEPRYAEAVADNERLRGLLREAEPCLPRFPNWVQDASVEELRNLAARIAAALSAAPADQPATGEVDCPATATHDLTADPLPAVPGDEREASDLQGILRAAFDRAGLTQAQLAEKLDVHPGEVSRRLHNPADLRWSTLTRTLAAMGAHLILAVPVPLVVDGQRCEPGTGAGVADDDEGAAPANEKHHGIGGSCSPACVPDPAVGYCTQGQGPDPADDFLAARPVPVDETAPLDPEALIGRRIVDPWGETATIHGVVPRPDGTMGLMGVGDDDPSWGWTPPTLDVLRDALLPVDETGERR